jgi:hypothetical protein
MIVPFRPLPDYMREPHSSGLRQYIRYVLDCLGGFGVREACIGGWSSSISWVEMHKSTKKDEVIGPSPTVF